VVKTGGNPDLQEVYFARTCQKRQVRRGRIFDCSAQSGKRWQEANFLPQPSTRALHFHLTPCSFSTFFSLASALSTTPPSVNSLILEGPERLILRRVLAFQPASVGSTRQLVHPRPTPNIFENLGHFAMVLLADS
jgi:hypothetical protein